MKVSGKFKVNLTPLEYSHQPENTAVQFGRMSIDKTFEGPLEATSKGEMLSARSTDPGKAGYVAIEYVEGTLEGIKGGFALQHFGTMNGEQSRLLLEVVPGSGSGALKNISGHMQINATDGSHSYEFDYTL